MVDDNLNNPMRFALGDRRIDMDQYGVDVTEIEIRVSKGSLYVHWTTESDR